MKTDLPATVEFYISVAEECVCVSIANLRRKRERERERERGKCREGL